MRGPRGSRASELQMPPGTPRLQARPYARWARPGTGDGCTPASPRGAAAAKQIRKPRPRCHLKGPRGAGVNRGPAQAALPGCRKAGSSVSCATPPRAAAVRAQGTRSKSVYLLARARTPPLLLPRLLSSYWLLRSDCPAY